MAEVSPLAVRQIPMTYSSACPQRLNVQNLFCDPRGSGQARDQAVRDPSVVERVEFVL